MKTNPSAVEMAEKLKAAASRPLMAVAPLQPSQPQEAPKKSALKAVETATVPPVEATVQKTLRPKVTVLQRYEAEAVRRTKETGKGVSAQEIMNEVLERNAP